jgi:hypothetical protein
MAELSDVLNQYQDQIIIRVVADEEFDRSISTDGMDDFSEL